MSGSTLRGLVRHHANLVHPYLASIGDTGQINLTIIAGNLSLKIHLFLEVQQHIERAFLF